MTYTPKVGEVCEIASTHQIHYFKAAVLFLGKEYAILDTGSGEEAFLLKHIKFRKIETEEDIFVEAFCKFSDSKGYISSIQKAKGFYEADFRYVGGSE